MLQAPELTGGLPFADNAVDGEAAPVDRATETLDVETAAVESV